MAIVIDKWNPPVLDKPDYYDTVRYIYKYIEFHISEDEAYTVLNAFIERWDAAAGTAIKEEELTKHVIEQLQQNFEVLLPRKKIERIVELILRYLFETGHFFQQEINK